MAPEIRQFHIGKKMRGSQRVNADSILRTQSGITVSMATNSDAEKLNPSSISNYFEILTVMILVVNLLELNL